jgi:outer membrane protein assembly factor BamD
VKRIVYVLIVVLIISGCSSNKAFKQIPNAEKLKIADQYFEQGKYRKAVPYYEAIIFDKGTPQLERAQKRLADCFFYQNKFTEARFEYQELIRLFRDAKNAGYAHFQIGRCYFEESLSAHYTQTETRNAIAAFQTFIEKFPFDEKKKEAIEYIQKCQYKLLEKKYYNGYTYYKMFDYPAALMYFDEIIALGNNNEVDMLSLYYSARIFIYRLDQENAELMRDQLQNKYPDSKYTKKINLLMQRKFK